jgi:isoleucyl-tRNA synthetase
MAPILPFTAEEIWEALPKAKGDPESVHLAVFPKHASEETWAPGDPATRAELRDQWERLFILREEVTRALEAERREGRIGGSIEAAVLLKASGSVEPLLRAHQAHLPALFIVSKVDVQAAAMVAAPSGLEVVVTRAPGTKCDRCWNVLESVGQDVGLPNLCARCCVAVREISRGAH